MPHFCCRILIVQSGISYRKIKFHTYDCNLKCTGHISKFCFVYALFFVHWLPWREISHLTQKVIYNTRFLVLYTDFPQDVSTTYLNSVFCMVIWWMVQNNETLQTSKIQQSIMKYRASHKASWTSQNKWVPGYTCDVPPKLWYQQCCSAYMLYVLCVYTYHLNAHIHKSLVRRNPILNILESIELLWTPSIIARCHLLHIPIIWSHLGSLIQPLLLAWLTGVLYIYIY